MERIDPLLGFRFLVEMEGLAGSGFQRVKGLQRVVTHESYREGGVNEYEHKLVSQVSYPAVILERGLAGRDLWQWALDVSEGRIMRRSIRILLQTVAGESAWAWQLDWALPVKWTCSDLDANASQVAMESVEFVHHRLTKATP